MGPSAVAGAPCLSFGPAIDNFVMNHGNSMCTELNDFMSETCGRKLAVWKLKCIYSTYGMKQSAPILSSIVPRSPRRESECERSGTRQVMERWGGGRRSRKRGGQTQRAQSLSAAPLIRSRRVDRSGRWGRRVACGHRGVGAGGRPNESPSRCLLPTVRELHGR